MAVGDLTLSRLRRTLKTIFGIGTINIKDSAGVVQLRNSGDTAFVDVAGNKLRVQGNNATNAVVLNAPNALGGTVTFTFPAAVGSTNQVLADVGGDGTLGFINVSNNSDLTQAEDFTEATTSPLTIFTPPANAIIREVTIVVTVAAAAGNPTVNVGTSGDPDAYMDETEVDLKTTGTYTVYPLIDVGGSPSAVILTIVPDSQTFSGEVYVTYSNPA
jgi:hypothetical protein